MNNPLSAFGCIVLGVFILVIFGALHKAAYCRSTKIITTILALAGVAIAFYGIHLLDPSFFNRHF